MSSTTQLDANQVIKRVYDDTTGALSTTPNYVSATTLLSAVPAGVSITSSAVYVLPYKIVGVMANWAGLDAATGTLQFQGSLDQTIWDNIGSAVTLASASGHQSFSLIDEPYQYIRIVYTHVGNTTGTVTVKYVLRA